MTVGDLFPLKNEGITQGKHSIKVKSGNISNGSYIIELKTLNIKV